MLTFLKLLALCPENERKDMISGVGEICVNPCFSQIEILVHVVCSLRYIIYSKQIIKDMCKDLATR